QCAEYDRRWLLVKIVDRRFTLSGGSTFNARFGLERLRTNRKQLPDGDALRKHRLEFVVDQKYLVDGRTFCRVHFDQLTRDDCRVFVIDGSRGHVDVLAQDFHRPPSKEVAASSPYGDKLDRFSRMLA